MHKFPEDQQQKEEEEKLIAFDKVKFTICSQTPSRSGHPSSFTLFRILSSARFATSCSAAFRCKKVFWDLYRAPSTHTVDLNLGIWAGPSFKVWYTGSCKDDFCVYSCRRFLYIRLSGRPENSHANKNFNPSALSSIIKL